MTATTAALASIPTPVWLPANATRTATRSRRPLFTATRRRRRRASVRGRAAWCSTWAIDIRTAVPPRPNPLAADFQSRIERTPNGVPTRDDSPPAAVPTLFPSPEDQQASIRLIELSQTFTGKSTPCETALFAAFYGVQRRAV